MATIREVAKRAGVAPITVSRVINNTGYISEDTRVRVEAAIHELQYIPNSISRSLRFKKTNTIALIVSDITNPFWTTVTRGVEDASSEHGLSVILCNSDEKEDKLENYVNVLLQRQTDGFLIVPINTDPQVVQRIQKRDVPVVVMDRPLPNVDVVRSDSEQGGYDMVKYLIDMGHRRIAILTGPARIATAQQRIDGYRRALQDQGIPLDDTLVYVGEYRMESGYQMVSQLLETEQPLPTAIFAANNFIALGVLKRLQELEMRVPQDVSVVTFGDLPAFVLQPFLTLMAQSPYQMGYSAAKLLINQITGQELPGDREIMLPLELIIRDSCAPPRVL